jgi:hypothetical protein
MGVLLDDCKYLNLSPFLLAGHHFNRLAGPISFISIGFLEPVDKMIAAQVMQRSTAFQNGSVGLCAFLVIISVKTDGNDGLASLNYLFGVKISSAWYFRQSFFILLELSLLVLVSLEDNLLIRFYLPVSFIRK